MLPSRESPSSHLPLAFLFLHRLSSLACRSLVRRQLFSVLCPLSSLARRSLGESGFLPAHYRHKQIRDTGPAYLAQRDELLAIHILEQQNATAEDRALMNRLQSAR